MSAAPFDVQAVIERVRTGVPALRQVAGAADLAAIRVLTDFPAPCAFVVLARESFEPSKSGMGLPGTQSRLPQLAQVNFAVVLAVRNYRTAERGAQLTGTLQQLLGAIRAALLGWVPDTTGARACQLKQGEVTSYDAGVMLWTDLWQTQHFVRS